MHADWAVGLPLSDAKEFAKDRSGGQCLDGALASFNPLDIKLVQADGETRYHGRANSTGS